MDMRFGHRPTRYMLGVAMAAALAAGTGGLAGASSAGETGTASGNSQCSTSITSDNFGTANSGPYGGQQTVWRYTLTNSHCMRVRVITYGATVQSIEVPDQNGHLTNVA